MTDHRYETHVEWHGSTGAGYRGYSREHRGVTTPATTEFQLSADPHFLGDPARTNPEQLLVMAASSCQLLSFLALASRRGVEVTGYVDDALGTMPSGSNPMRMTEISLRPRITVAAGTDTALVEELVQEAHGTCYVAASLKTSVTVHAVVTAR